MSSCGIGNSFLDAGGRKYAVVYSNKSMPGPDACFLCKVNQARFRDHHCKMLREEHSHRQDLADMPLNSYGSITTCSHFPTGCTVESFLSMRRCMVFHHKMKIGISAVYSAPKKLG